MSLRYENFLQEKLEAERKLEQPPVIETTVDSIITTLNSKYQLERAKARHLRHAITTLEKQHDR